MQTRKYLNPKLKLVDAVTDELVTRVRETASGAQSLAHLMVIVPTAQAGRRLRLALAARFDHGVIPPVVKMPAHLLEPASADLPVADAVTELAVLADTLCAATPDDYPVLFPHAPERRTFADAVDVAQGLQRVWSIIGENGLLMRDVAAKAPELLKGDNLDLEVARWEDLTRLEEAFLKTLHGKGLRFRGESASLAVATPSVPEGVEEIILPALLSPIPAMYRVVEAMGLPVTVLIHANETDGENFDQWGRVVNVEGGFLEDLGLQDEQISVFATTGAEAESVADWFAAVKPEEALPARTLADNELFPEMQGTF